MIFDTIPTKDVVDVISKSNTKKDVLVSLNIKPDGYNYKLLDNYCRLHTIDLTPLNIRRYAIQTQKAIKKIRIADTNVFCENSNYCYGRNLARRMVSCGHKYKCDKCGNCGEWMNSPITLHVDHINGVHNDNRHENLRFLCPNCHQQTPTWGNKNRSNVSKNTRCLICKSPLIGSSRKYCSRACVGVATGQRQEGKQKLMTRKVKRPELTILMQEIKDSNWCAIAKKYGVSDNTLRKWFKSAGINPNIIKPKSRHK